MSEEEKVIAILKKVRDKYFIQASQRQCKQIRWAIDVAIRIVEKQVPKKPHADDNGGAEDYESWIECPECGEVVPEYTYENETECYCVGCGKKLKWEDE